jgi:hypothetical protein
MAEPPLQTLKESKPNPDPTVATNDAVARAVRAERDYVDLKIENVITRLDAMDEATRVLKDDVTRTPTLLQTAIKSFGELMDEKFSAITDKFKAAESLRLEQKQDSKTGLDAALAAQKEAAGTQDINNQKAIDKSEKATAEIIKNNQDANKASIDTLTKTVDEVKTDVNTIKSVKLGSGEASAGSRANIALAISVVLFLLTIIGFVLTLASKGN